MESKPCRCGIEVNSKWTRSETEVKVNGNQRVLKRVQVSPLTPTPPQSFYPTLVGFIVMATLRGGSSPSYTIVKNGRIDYDPGLKSEGRQVQHVPC